MSCVYVALMHMHVVLPLRHFPTLFTILFAVNYNLTSSGSDNCLGLPYSVIDHGCIFSGFKWCMAVHINIPLEAFIKNF